MESRESKGVVDADMFALRGTETIMVVDDSDDVRELTVRALGGYGYTMLEASSGAEGLDLADAHRGRIGLLVADLVMPGMSGATLGSRMAQLFPAVKVLYVSGYIDRGSSAQELLSPTAAWLRKPFMPGVLARKVREILDAA